MKRVLIFSLAYYPKYVGGAEIAIKEITDRIPSSEFEFHMVTLRFDSALPKTEQVGNVLVHRIGFVSKNPSMADLKKFPLAFNKFLFQGLAPLYALSLHRKYRFDISWAMMAHATGIAAALFKMLVPRVRYVLTLQEGDPPEHIERLARPAWPLFRRAFSSADAVSVISNFLGRWAKRMGFQGEPVLVPNGVDTALVSRSFSEAELSALKTKLGKKEGDIFLITTSRLVHKNAIDDVIRALSLLPSSVHFLILGNGPLEKALKALARSEKVEGRVHFLGFMKLEDIPLYLKVSDIFIRPSRSEGMGSSFIEAFAAGLPVIATQEGGIADFLFDAKRDPERETTGWAVDVNAPQQIAEAVMDILGNPQKARQVIESARLLALSKYEWSTISKDMKEKIFMPASF